MSRRPRGLLLFVFLAAAAAAVPLHGETLLLNASSYVPAQLLPAPPADGSTEQQQELLELHRIQSGMGDADFAQAALDDKTEDVTAFAAVLGPWFDLAKLPKTAALFTVVRNEEKAAAKLAKAHFLRTRPWVLDPSLKTCTRSDAPQSSYPSGHATMGYSMAVVLGAMLPDKAPELMMRAKAYAENRLTCGVHYRSDIVAGQVLGTVVAEELLADPEFRRDFEAAKAEVLSAMAQQK